MLVLFHDDGTINPDFVRQLAALQMLRDTYHLALHDPDDTGTGTGTGTGAGAGAERTHVLALWVGPTARKWSWARDQLLRQVAQPVRRDRPRGEWDADSAKVVATNLGPLAELAGFSADTAAASWWAHPTHTLRFAEESVTKICDSEFTVGELLYLFTASDHLDGDDPFPLPGANDTRDDPLEVPHEEDPRFALSRLRRQLLRVEVSAEDAEQWSWYRIEETLREEFGYTPSASGDDLLRALAEHFFGSALDHHPGALRLFRVPLRSTTPAMWNTGEGPFRYESGVGDQPGALVTELPLRDGELLEQLSHLRELSADERGAVRDLYFLPRLELAPLAFLFTNFEHAVQRLIAEPDQRRRWRFFQHQVALCYQRSRLIAEHLAEHVSHVTGTYDEHGAQVAWRLLRDLLADENRASAPWENDLGTPPATVWDPPPGGGAFAGLLGLVGTGLLGDSATGPTGRCSGVSCAAPPTRSATPATHGTRRPPPWSPTWPPPSPPSKPDTKESVTASQWPTPAPNVSAGPSPLPSPGTACCSSIGPGSTDSGPRTPPTSTSTAMTITPTVTAGVSP